MNVRVSFSSLWDLMFSGWLHKEMKSGGKSTSLKLKKRWFVLNNSSLDYYKSSEKSASKLGTLVLNSLCSVVQPEEKVFKETGERSLAEVLEENRGPSACRGCKASAAVYSQ